MTPRDIASHHFTAPTRTDASLGPDIHPQLRSALAFMLPSTSGLRQRKDSAGPPAFLRPTDKKTRSTSLYARYVRFM